MRAAWHQAHARRVRYNFTGQAQGHHGATVVSAGEGDHASTASGCTGDLDGVFDRFRTSGHQQGFLLEVARHFGVDFFAQFYVRLVSQYLEAGVGQLGQLLLYSGNDIWVGGASVTCIDGSLKL